MRLVMNAPSLVGFDGAALLAVDGREITEHLLRGVAITGTEGAVETKPFLCLVASCFWILLHGRLLSKMPSPVARLSLIFPEPGVGNYVLTTYIGLWLRAAAGSKLSGPSVAAWARIRLSIRF